MEPRKVSEIIDSVFVDPIAELQYAYKSEAVLTQPRMIYRVGGGAGDRYYYRIDEQPSGDNQIIFYISTTTFTKKVLPTSPFLLQWMKENGEESDKMRDMAADFGTLMHICISDFFMFGFDFYATRELVTKYVEKLGHHQSIIPAWTQKLNKNMASFKQFCNDYEIEPLLIEVMLGSDEMGIAGTLDLVAKVRTPEMRKAHEKALKEWEKAAKAAEKAGEEIPTEPQMPGKVNASIDYKSGGIYDSSELQLAINKQIFHENFPDINLDLSLNWSPKDWRENPTYTVVDQTETKFTYKVIQSFMLIYEALYPNDIAESKIFDFGGRIFNDGSPVNGNARKITLTERIENQVAAREKANAQF